VTEYQQLTAWLARVNLPHVTVTRAWEPPVTFVDGVRVFGEKIENCLVIILGDDVGWWAVGKHVEDSAAYVPGDEGLTDGYGYFYHQFVFHPDGHLIESSTWE
jgi:hypothetical protein